MWDLEQAAKIVRRSLESSVGGNTGKGVLGAKENGADPKP